MAIPSTPMPWTTFCASSYVPRASARSSGITPCGSTTCHSVGEGFPMRVGFIGVGNIGQPMASQLLQAGHALVVHDLRPEAAASLLAAGATWADTPRAVVAQCDVIATCLPGPA